MHYAARTSTIHCPQRAWGPKVQHTGVVSLVVIVHLAKLANLMHWKERYRCITNHYHPWIIRCCLESSSIFASANYYREISILCSTHAFPMHVSHDAAFALVVAAASLAMTSAVELRRNMDLHFSASSRAKSAW